MSFFKGLTSGNRTPKDYETVEDHKDLRIPVQSEEAFEHGITFKAKYIGTEEIAKPSSRVEIVSSMRRIRYEYKYRNIKKRKVFIDISVEGIRVTLWKKKRKTQDINFNDQKLFVMHYPINRVFYVSHDSQDLKILSYIARGEDGIFRCSVFKALKKSQAMQVVRTIGQAFEVCHKINLQRQGPDEEDQGAESDKKPLDSEDDELKIEAKQSREATTDGETDIDDVGETDIDDPASPLKEDPQRTQSTMVTDLDQINPPVPPKVPLLVQNGDAARHRVGPFTIAQLQQLYHQQLQQTINEAEAAKAELTLYRDKLRVETEARMESQARVHKLLAQNRELIVTVQKLMGHLQDNYSKQTGEPIDERWILQMNASDAFFKSGAPPVLPPLEAGDPGFIDFESSVYDNIHNQFARFEESACSDSFVSNNDFLNFLNNSEAHSNHSKSLPDTSSADTKKSDAREDSHKTQVLPAAKVDPATRVHSNSKKSASPVVHKTSSPSTSVGGKSPPKPIDTNLTTQSQDSISQKSNSIDSGSETKTGSDSKPILEKGLANGTVSSSSQGSEHNLSKEIMTTFSDELYQLGLSDSKSIPSASLSSTETSQESIRKSGTLPEVQGYEPLIDMD